MRKRNNIGMRARGENLEGIQEEFSQIGETVSEKRPRTEKSESKMDTDVGGETSQTSSQLI